MSLFALALTIGLAFSGEAHAGEAYDIQHRVDTAPEEVGLPINEPIYGILGLEGAMRRLGALGRRERARGGVGRKVERQHRREQRQQRARLHTERAQSETEAQRAKLRVGGRISARALLSAKRPISSIVRCLKPEWRGLPRAKKNLGPRFR